MPIEIIKRSDKYIHKKATFSCGHCQSFLEALVKDGQLTRDSHIEYVIFTCPVCNGKINVPLIQFN